MWVWDTGGKTRRLLSHFAGGAIDIPIAWHFWDRQNSGSEEGGNCEAEASHLDVRSIFREIFGSILVSVKDGLYLQLQA